MEVKFLLDDLHRGLLWIVYDDSQLDSCLRSKLTGSVPQGASMNLMGLWAWPGLQKTAGDLLYIGL